MAKVAFTKNLRRHVACPEVEAAGATVREVLDVVFRDNPALRGYVVDEQGALRKHMAIFVDGDQVQDRAERREQPWAADQPVHDLVPNWAPSCPDTW